ncbi:isocitrate dehydrogenase, NAD-dependent, mitochondrial, partial [Volvox carteri f. nagariensis]
ARGLITSYLPSPGDAAPQVVTLIPGDGIGPEVTKSVVDVVAAMGAPITWERFDYLSGSEDGKVPRTSVPKEVLDSIRRNGVCLKGTLFTQLDKNNTNTQSLNVQLRKDLDLHVNVVHGYSIPGLSTRHSGLDIVVIRENTEGEYSGLEHEVVDGVVESLKIITYEKSLRTAQYAFEFAFLNHRKKVSAIHKANIMKQGDGLFLKRPPMLAPSRGRACREVARNFPRIQYEEVIVDNTCMQLVGRPQQFDVMVTPNLYGNLVSNVVAGLCGGFGVVPGGNIGDGVAVFEQVYASGDKASLTPDVGGSGTLLGFTEAVVRNLERPC